MQEASCDWVTVHVWMIKVQEKQRDNLKWRVQAKRYGERSLV